MKPLHEVVIHAPADASPIIKGHAWGHAVIKEGYTVHGLGMWPGPELGIYKIDGEYYVVFEDPTCVAESLACIRARSATEAELTVLTGVLRGIEEAVQRPFSEPVPDATCDGC